MRDRFKVRVWLKNEHSYYQGEGEYYYDVQSMVVFRDGKAITVMDAIDKGIIPNAVKEQCTGLKDRNGKLIYEGDILSSEDEVFCERYKVEFCQEYSQFLLRGINTTGGAFGIIKPNTLKVIGNIHENPELLEG